MVTRAGCTCKALKRKVVTFKPNVVATAGGFGAMPLVIVSAESNAEAQMAAEAAKLSSAGAHVVVKNTGHWIQLDQPKAVVDAVMKVLGH